MLPPDSGERAGLFARAHGLFAELDRFGDKRLEFWRGGQSRSHRWVFLASAVVGVAVLNIGVYTMAVLSTGVVGIGSGWLFSVAFAGFVVGLITWAPWAGWFSVRTVTVVSLLMALVGYGMFVAASGPVGYFAAAVVLGVATSGFPQLEAGTQRWVETTVTERRNRADRKVWWSGSAVTAFVLLATLIAVSTMLQVQEWLVTVSLPAAAAVLAVVAVIAAGLLWITAPPLHPTRPAVGSVRHGWLR